MRIIFSRKGFDSSAGGCPSPVIDGRPVSLPIPEQTRPSPTVYGDLAAPLPSLVRDLTSARLSDRHACHLDPDIDRSALPRSDDWRGAFGQSGTALSHLRNQSVGPGDLFLFWGLYRDVLYEHGRWRFDPAARPVHLIFGWLQIGQVVDVNSKVPGPTGAHPWLARHPHLHGIRKGSNAIFVASEKLHSQGGPSHIDGWGVFSRGAVLTSPNARFPSSWRVPNWLNPHTGGCGMTYHKDRCWKSDGTLDVVRRGQEFVADPDDRSDAHVWVRNIIEEHS